MIKEVPLNRSLSIKTDRRLSTIREKKDHYQVFTKEVEVLSIYHYRILNNIPFLPSFQSYHLNPYCYTYLKRVSSEDRSLKKKMKGVGRSQPVVSGVRIVLSWNSTGSCKDGVTGSVTMSLLILIRTFGKSGVLSIVIVFLPRIT